MDSKKSVGQNMEPWRTPSLTGYSYEDFPFRNTQCRLLMRGDKITPEMLDLKIQKT